MTAIVHTEPASDQDLSTAGPGLLIDVLTAHNTCLVHVTGELDLATRDQLVAASTAGHHPSMVIDLGGVTFMDCSGYSSLTASRRIIRSQGRSLTIVGQTGQPARLLALIAEMEKCPLQPALKRRPASPHHLIGSRRRVPSAAVRVAIRRDC